MESIKTDEYFSVCVIRLSREPMPATHNQLNRFEFRTKRKTLLECFFFCFYSLCGSFARCSSLLFSGFFFKRTYTQRTQCSHARIHTHTIAGRGPTKTHKRAQRAHTFTHTHGTSVTTANAISCVFLLKQTKNSYDDESDRKTQLRLAKERLHSSSSTLYQCTQQWANMPEPQYDFLVAVFSAHNTCSYNWAMENEGKVLGSAKWFFYVGSIEVRARILKLVCCGKIQMKRRRAQKCLENVETKLALKMLELSW